MRQSLLYLSRCDEVTALLPGTWPGLKACLGLQAIFVQGYQYQTQVLLDGHADAAFARPELLDFELQMNPQVTPSTFKILNQVRYVLMTAQANLKEWFGDTGCVCNKVLYHERSSSPYRDHPHNKQSSLTGTAKASHTLAS